MKLIYKKIFLDWKKYNYFVYYECLKEMESKSVKSF